MSVGSQPTHRQGREFVFMSSGAVNQFYTKLCKPSNHSSCINYCLIKDFHSKVTETVIRISMNRGRVICVISCWGKRNENMCNESHSEEYTIFQSRRRRLQWHPVCMVKKGVSVLYVWRCFYHPLPEKYIKMSWAEIWLIRVPERLGTQKHYQWESDVYIEISSVSL